MTSLKIKCLKKIEPRCFPGFYLIKGRLPCIVLMLCLRGAYLWYLYPHVWVLTTAFASRLKLFFLFFFQHYQIDWRANARNVQGRKNYSRSQRVSTHIMVYWGLFIGCLNTAGQLLYWELVSQIALFPLQYHHTEVNSFRIFWDNLDGVHWLAWGCDIPDHMHGCNGMPDMKAGWMNFPKVNVFRMAVKQLKGGSLLSRKWSWLLIRAI